MNNKFTVISNDGIEQPPRNRGREMEKLNEAWSRQYQSAFMKAVENNKDLKSFLEASQDDLMRIAFAGIKFIGMQRDIRRENERIEVGYKKPEEQSQYFYQFIDLIFTICGQLTLKNFVITFPITKSYDGEKWEMKDYFYTMDVLNEMDWNKPIGREQISELLWDYQNDDLREAYVEYMGAMSDIYQFQTGEGIMEQWCEDNGIETFSANHELGIIKSSKTGKISKLKEHSHLTVVK